MRLYLIGHDYKYAVEQMLLTLYPEERPEYPEGKPSGERMELRLSRGARYVTAACVLHRGGGVWHGRAAAPLEKLGDGLETDRVCQRLVKNAMYRAALRAGHQKPAWGALTGVRPGKLFCALLQQGLDEQEALRRFIEEYDVSPERAALCLDTGRQTMKLAAALEKRDVCLYVGIPFCPTRCAYCSFVSQSVEKKHEADGTLPRGPAAGSPRDGGAGAAAGPAGHLGLHGRRHADDADGADARPALRHAGGGI